MSAPPGVWRAALAVVRRPDLWWIGALMAFRLAAPGWWRRWPPLPYPDRAYWALRLSVAYGGDGERGPDPTDVVAYLRWCRRNWHRSRRVLR